MRKWLALFFLLSPLLYAQSTQLGGMVGVGGAVKLFDNSSHHTVGGVEACVFCGGRFGLFLEYEHWAKTSSGSGEPGSMNLAGGGVRIQGKSARLRPFLDAGLLAGAESKKQVRPSFENESRAVAGGALGFGVAISVTAHWYVRPLARMVVLSTGAIGGFGGLSAGYSF
jgi:hypothetical protein